VHQISPEPLTEPSFSTQPHNLNLLSCSPPSLHTEDIQSSKPVPALYPAILCTDRYGLMELCSSGLPARKSTTHQWSWPPRPWGSLHPPSAWCSLACGYG